MGATTRRDFVKQAAGVGATLLGAQAVQALAAASGSAPASGPATTTAPGTGPDRRWRIGCSTRPWEGFDYPIAFEAIAEAGYQYVGPMTARTKTGW